MALHTNIAVKNLNSSIIWVGTTRAAILKIRCEAVQAIRCYQSQLVGNVFVSTICWTYLPQAGNYW